MLRIIFSLLLVLILFAAGAQSKYQKDYTYFWQTIRDNYAYFSRQHINWDLAKQIYQTRADTCSSANSFIHLLEDMTNELYNGHSFLNTNTPASNRLVPSGADLKLVYRNGKFIIDELRPGFGAAACGLKKGMTIVAMNGNPLTTALLPFIPKGISKPDKAMLEYAANMLLAGTHDKKRNITASVNGATHEYQPDLAANLSDHQNDTTLLEWKKLQNGTGYIRIHNSLGNTGLIKDFDEALTHLFSCNGLIIDLRDTPGGGITNVARAIMGRFIQKEMPYQKHIYTAEERESGITRSTLELVSPRSPVYTKPLVILVSYWTASMGEGIAIGFDAMKRATVVGTPMAGLLGEIYSFQTPELNIPFSFPCVQLQTINGLPREAYLPAVISDQGQCLQKGLEILLKSKNRRQ